MPCFYCGKRVPLVRQLTDADFCSEEHRRKYHELTRTALNRLVEAHDHLAAAAPKRRSRHAAATIAHELLEPPPEWGALPYSFRLAMTASSPPFVPAEFAVCAAATRLPSLSLSRAVALLPTVRPLPPRVEAQASRAQAAARMAPVGQVQFGGARPGRPRLGRYYQSQSSIRIRHLVKCPLVSLVRAAPPDHSAVIEAGAALSFPAHSELLPPDLAVAADSQPRVWRPIVPELLRPSARNQEAGPQRMELQLQGTPWDITWPESAFWRMVPAGAGPGSAEQALVFRLHRPFPLGLPTARRVESLGQGGYEAAFLPPELARPSESAFTPPVLPPAARSLGACEAWGPAGRAMAVQPAGPAAGFAVSAPACPDWTPRPERAFLAGGAFRPSSGLSLSCAPLPGGLTQHIAPAAFPEHHLGLPRLDLAPGVHLVWAGLPTFDTQALRKHRAASPRWPELERMGASREIFCTQSPLWQLRPVDVEPEAVEKAALPGLASCAAVAAPPARTPQHRLQLGSAELLPRSAVFPEGPGCARPAGLPSVPLAHPGELPSIAWSAMHVPRPEPAAESPETGISRPEWAGTVRAGSLARATHLPVGCLSEPEAARQVVITEAGFQARGAVLPEMRWARFITLAPAAPKACGAESSFAGRGTAVPRRTEAQISAAGLDPTWRQSGIWQIEPVAFDFGAPEQPVSPLLCGYLAVPTPMPRPAEAAPRLQSPLEVPPQTARRPRASALLIPQALSTAAWLPTGSPAAQAPQTPLRPSPEPIAEFSGLIEALPVLATASIPGALAQAAACSAGASAEAGAPAEQAQPASAPAFRTAAWSLPRWPVSLQRFDLPRARERALVLPQHSAPAPPTGRGMAADERIVPAPRAVSIPLPRPWAAMVSRALHLPVAQPIELVPTQAAGRGQPESLEPAARVPSLCLSPLRVRVPRWGVCAESVLALEPPGARETPADLRQAPELAFRICAPWALRLPALPASPPPGTRAPLALPLSCSVRDAERSARSGAADPAPMPVHGPILLPTRHAPAVVGLGAVGLCPPAKIAIKMPGRGVALPRVVRREISSRLPAMSLLAAQFVPPLGVRGSCPKATLAQPKVRPVPVAARWARGPGWGYPGWASPRAGAGLKPCVLGGAPLMSIALPVRGSAEQAARHGWVGVSLIMPGLPAWPPASGRPATAALSEGGSFSLSRDVRDRKARPLSCTCELEVRSGAQLKLLLSSAVVEAWLTPTADFQSLSLPRARSAGFARLPEFEGGFEPGAARWPEPTGIPELAPFRTAEWVASRLPSLVERVLPRAALEALTETTLSPAHLPARTCLPALAASLGRTDLLPASSVGLESRRVDTLVVTRFPPGHSIRAWRPAVPSVACKMECADDLDWPWPVPIEPQWRPQKAATQDRPAEVALVRQPLLPRCALLPARHWFYLPVTAARAPWKSISRRWKAAGAGRFLILALVLLGVPGFMAWNSGARDSLRLSLQKRAAIELDESFGSGLDQWMGLPGDWSRDPAGFVRVGSLALLRPSLGMADYRLEFLGQVGRRSLGWVFRAPDLENYYASRIVLAKPGPLPSLALERYGVTDGREGPRVRTPLRLRGRENSAYKVVLQVRGNDFTTLIDGQVVDFWSDDRLKVGGVGFFSDPQDPGALFWVRVSHQDDLLGRVCAYLAPKQIETRNGSRK